MSNNIKIKTGEQTNVKSGNVIDFSTIDTKSREDDKKWNAMQFYCEDDNSESNYESIEMIDAVKMSKIRRKADRVFGKRTLHILSEVA